MVNIATASSPMAEYLCRIYETGSDLLSNNKQTIFSSVEALFYHRVQITSKKLGELSRWITEFARNHFAMLQFTFASFNAMIILSSANEIVNHLKFPIIRVLSGTFLGSYLPAVGLAFLLIATSWVAISYLSASPGTYKSRAQLFSGAVQVTGIITSLALAVFADNKISLMATAALNAYSFLKNKDWNWLSVTTTKTDPDGPNRPISKAELTYSALARKSEGDDCSICLEKSDLIFCFNGHGTHQPCLDKLLENEKKHLHQDNVYTRRVTDVFENGRYVRTDYSYLADVQEKNLPACPLCRKHLPQNQLDIKIQDKRHPNRIFQANVSIIKDKPKSHQSVFEKVYAIYSSFQGTLATLQQVPELAGGVTILRRFMIVTDIIFGVMANYYLYKSLKENDKPWFYAVVPAALAAIPVFLGLERLFGKREDLSRLVPEGISAKWEMPTFERVHRLFDTYRLLTTIGLSCVSKAHKAFNITSVAMQGLALWGALSLPWIRVDQNLYDAGVRTYAIYVAKNVEGLKNAVASIIALQKEVLSKGTFWLVESYNNGVVSRAIDLSYNQFPTIQNIREYVTKPFLWDWSYKHSRYGMLSMHILGQSFPQGHL